MDSRDDERWLRHTFALARAAAAAGDQPFAAVLVSADGALLLEAGQRRVRDGDCTRHAETILAAEASRRWDWAFLARCTVYSSYEPCPMCAGALVWCGPGRVVYGLSRERGLALPEAPPPRFGGTVSCRDVLGDAQPPVAVVGPLLEDDAAAVFLEAD